MPDLWVRSLSDETVAALKAIAERNNRTLEAELADMIEQGVRDSSREALSAGVRRAREESAGKIFPDSSEIIRADRDSR